MNELIRAFSHLEKICNEMYNEKHGVSCYIDEMVRKTSFKAKSIPGWDTDLERLKRLRHVRNGIAHDDATVDTSYTYLDVKFLEDMYDRIIAGTDPLGQLRSQQKELKKVKIKPEQQVMEVHNEKSSGVKGTILVAAIVSLLLIFVTLIGVGWLYYMQ